MANQKYSMKPLLRYCFTLSIITTFAVTAYSQGGVGSSRGLPSTSGGIHTIQGKVHFPDTPEGASKRVRVRLDSSNFISQTTQTDEDGGFRFTQLEAGPYTITVDGGKDFESAVENVAIDREASVGGRILSVPIYLKPKPDSSVPAAALDNYRKAQQAAKSGNNKKAIQNLNAALQVYPNFTLALSELASIYLKTGETSKAEETLNTLLRLTPKDAAANLNLGIALFNEKKVAEAEAPLRAAVQLNSKLPAAHYYLGLVLVNLKKYDEAVKELEFAVNNGGENLALAHKYLGGLYMSSNKNQQAADELEKYLKLDPKAADADRIKGTIKDLRSKQ